MSRAALVALAGLPSIGPRRLQMLLAHHEPADALDRLARRAASGLYEEACGPLRAASPAGDDTDDPRRLVWSANADTWLGDLDLTLARQSRAIELARARGAFATLATGVALGLVGHLAV